MLAVLNQGQVLAGCGVFNNGCLPVAVASEPEPGYSEHPTKPPHRSGIEDAMMGALPTWSKKSMSWLLSTKTAYQDAA